jgi:hypothetical protein
MKKSFEKLAAAVGLAPRTGRRPAKAPAPARRRDSDAGFDRQEYPTEGRSRDLHKLTRREANELVVFFVPPEDPRRHPFAHYERGNLRTGTLLTALKRAGRAPEEFLEPPELARLREFQKTFEECDTARQELSWAVVRKAVKDWRRRIASGDRAAREEEPPKNFLMRDHGAIAARRQALHIARRAASKNAGVLVATVGIRMRPVIEEVLADVEREERQHFEAWGVEFQPSEVLQSLADTLTALRHDFIGSSLESPRRQAQRLGIDITAQPPTSNLKKSK